MPVIAWALVRYAAQLGGAWVVGKIYAGSSLPGASAFSQIFAALNAWFAGLVKWVLFSSYWIDSAVWLVQQLFKLGDYALAQVGAAPYLSQLASWMASPPGRAMFRVIGWFLDQTLGHSLVVACLNAWLVTFPIVIALRVLMYIKSWLPGMGGTQ